MLVMKRFALALAVFGGLSSAAWAQEAREHRVDAGYGRSLEIPAGCTASSVRASLTVVELYPTQFFQAAMCAAQGPVAGVADSRIGMNLLLVFDQSGTLIDRVPVSLSSPIFINQHFGEFPVQGRGVVQYSVDAAPGLAGAGRANGQGLSNTVWMGPHGMTSVFAARIVDGRWDVRAWD